ncbi:VOC family protein [Sediminibacillus massiliensis]|uniref:VOC family protein n=1 Tax=Sediminibacillus massiliensis TaxID=1926277 RepID=UPI0009883BF6|nr:VOC family protein [Sediminibacillus massiliensis]
MIGFESLHHVSLAVTDIDRAKDFYGNILGLKEIDRPGFDFPGAWYQIGSQQLHLISYPGSETIREKGEMETKDGHFAIRVKDYHQTLNFLKKQNVDVLEKPDSISGFAQIFCMDPDHNLIEFNVDQSSLGNG